MGSALVFFGARGRVTLGCFAGFVAVFGWLEAGIVGVAEIGGAAVGVGWGSGSAGGLVVGSGGSMSWFDVVVGFRIRSWRG